jgi:hypothetical protein
MKRISKASTKIKTITAMPKMRLNSESTLCAILLMDSGSQFVKFLPPMVSVKTFLLSVDPFEQSKEASFSSSQGLVMLYGDVTHTPHSPISIGRQPANYILFYDNINSFSSIFAEIMVGSFYKFSTFCHICALKRCHLEAATSISLNFLSGFGLEYLAETTLVI